jgi:hypothetical protein
MTKNWTGGEAQVGPEFKHQDHSHTHTHNWKRKYRTLLASAIRLKMGDFEAEQAT